MIAAKVKIRSAGAEPLTIAELDEGIHLVKLYARDWQANGGRKWRTSTVIYTMAQGGNRWALWWTATGAISAKLLPKT